MVTDVMEHSVDDRLTTDPHGGDDELAGDSIAWTVLLREAYRLDGANPSGCFGLLHCLRCCGARLVERADGHWGFARGPWMDADEWTRFVRGWTGEEGTRYRGLRGPGSYERTVKLALSKL